LSARLGRMVEDERNDDDQGNDMGADRPPVQRVRRPCAAVRERWRPDWRRQPYMEVCRLRQGGGSDGTRGVVLVRIQPQAQPQRDGLRLPAVHGSRSKAGIARSIPGLRLRPEVRRRSGDHAGARLTGRDARCALTPEITGSPSGLSG